jgi:proteasome beta subunit
MVQLILAGYDREGPSIYTFDPIGSIEKETKFFASGSGAPIALGVLEDKYKEGIGVKDGRELAIQAVKAAIERDVASGGRAIDVAVIRKEGVVKIESIPLK